MAPVVVPPLSRNEHQTVVSRRGASRLPVRSATPRRAGCQQRLAICVARPVRRPWLENSAKRLECVPACRRFSHRSHRGTTFRKREQVHAFRTLARTRSPASSGGVRPPLLPLAALTLHHPPPPAP